MTTAAVQIAGVGKVFNQGKPNAVAALVDIDLTISRGDLCP